MKQKRLWSYIIQAMFLIMVLVIVGFYLNDKMTKYRETQLPHSSYTLSEWRWIHEDGTEEPVVLPCKLPVKNGEIVILKTEVPYVTREGYRLAFFNYRDCKIYIENECRYAFDDEQANIVGGIVKGIWSFTKLNYHDAGKTITIVRDNPNTFNGEFKELYYGDSLGLVYNYLSRYALFYFCAILLVGLSIFLMIMGTFMRFSLGHRVPITELGTALLLCSLWMVYNSDLFQLTFDNFYIDGVLAYMLIMLVPTPILLYMNDMQKKRHEKLLYSAVVGSLISSAVFYIMHFTGFVNFEMNLVPIMIVFTVISILAFITIIMDMRAGGFREYKVMAVGLAVFIICVLLDVVFISARNTNLGGKFLLGGLYALFIAGTVQQLIEIYQADRAGRQAQEASKQKSTFLANMSHEIRTPINSIIGMNEMILRECKDSEIREYSLQVASSGKLLLGLVNDVLDFSKIEAGKMDIVAAPYNVSTMINDIEVMLSERAASKNLKTRYEIAEDIPKELIGDEIHIKQIIINLISNAVKYTNEGTITLEISSSASVIGGRVDLKFKVSDTGIGIRKESIDKLFDTFTRAEEQRNKSIEGTGLGLSIVKSLTEAMNGTINFDSEYGIGSTFTVDIPQEISDPTPIGNLADALSDKNSSTGTYVEKFRAPKAKILIVDDNAVNLKVAEELLKATRVQTDTASGGRECIYKCRDNVYDLILMDHRMPDPDGVATLHLLRDDFEGLNKSTKVIVLTANAFTGLREKYIAEGFADYLSKPIDPILLEETIMEHLPKELVETEFEKESNETTESVAVNNMSSWESRNPAPDFASAMRAVEGMDYDKTFEKYNGSEDFMKTLLKTIVMDGFEKIKLMEGYLAEHDYKNFGIEAHAAKSTMATIFAEKLSEHAKSHEFAAKEGRTDYIDSDGPVFIEEYRDMLNRIKAAMRNWRKEWENTESRSICYE